MTRGGDISPARSSEVTTAEEVTVALREAPDPGWFGSAGWNVSISTSPDWSVIVEAGLLEADLTAATVTALRVIADGWVRLADLSGEVPVFVRGDLVLEVPSDTSVEVNGPAQVGDGWETTTTGVRYVGTGDARILLEVAPGSDLVVERVVLDRQVEEAQGG